VKSTMERSEVSLLPCPHCRSPIRRHPRRYTREARSLELNLEKVKNLVSKRMSPQDFKELVDRTKSLLPPEWVRDLQSKAIDAAKRNREGIGLPTTISLVEKFLRGVIENGLADQTDELTKISELLKDSLSQDAFNATGQRHLSIEMQRAIFLGVLKGNFASEALLNKVKSLSFRSSAEEVDEVVREVQTVAVVHAMNISETGLQGGGHWHKCRNCGELFAIGECGGAMEMTKCANCGRGVGGGSHQLNANTDIAQRRIALASQASCGTKETDKVPSKI